MRGRTSGHAEGEVGKDRGAAQDGRGRQRTRQHAVANWARNHMASQAKQGKFTTTA